MTLQDSIYVKAGTDEFAEALNSLTLNEEYFLSHQAITSIDKDEVNDQWIINANLKFNDSNYRIGKASFELESAINALGREVSYLIKLPETLININYPVRARCNKCDKKSHFYITSSILERGEFTCDECSGNAGGSWIIDSDGQDIKDFLILELK